MQQIELNQAKLNIAELFNQALNGNVIIITDNNHPILKLARIDLQTSKRELGTAEGEVWMSPDFNDSYDEWMEEWEKPTL